MKKYVIMLFLSQIIGWTALGQQVPQFSQYMYERFLYNPGYAGTYTNSIELAINSRYQWTKYNAGPKTINIGVHGPLNRKNYAIGGKMISDLFLPYQMFGIWGTVARKFRLPVGMLSVGIEPGIISNTLYGGRKLHDTDDMVFDNSILSSHLLPDVSAGVFFNSNRIYAGVSALHLAPTRYGYKRFERDKYARLYTTFFVMAGAELPFHTDWKFEPASLIKIVETGLYQATVSGSVKFRNVASIGASYRTDKAIIPFLRVILQDHINISYSYDHYSSQIHQLSGNNHEILFRYIIPVDPYQKAAIDPRYY